MSAEAFRPLVGAMAGAAANTDLTAHAYPALTRTSRGILGAWTAGSGTESTIRVQRIDAP